MAEFICQTLMKTLQCLASSLLAASDRYTVVHTHTHTPVAFLAPSTHTFVCQRDIFIVLKERRAGGLTGNV